MLSSVRFCCVARLALVSSIALLGAACGSDEAVSPAPGAMTVPAGGAPADPGTTPAAGGSTSTDGSNPESPGELPLDMNEPGSVEPGMDDTPPGEELPSSPSGTVNLFTELLGVSEAEVNAKVQLVAERLFGIGTNEPATPTADVGYRVYYELPQDPSQAFIWAADSNDIRSEGMSYGMMIAVQMDMQEQFDKLWNFARAYMQFPGNSASAAWRYYFRWQGSVNTANPANWQVNYGADTGPAPDGDEYFAAALYLAARRWGSDGAVNYKQEADNIASAMLNNPGGDAGRTPIINPAENKVVFFPQGGAATYSDPSYHLPAFYELFAKDGPEGDSMRWRQVAETSRQFLVTSANPTTGLHPDYANFDGTPNAGGSNHDQFRYDAWRVVMNMAIDHAWGSQDARMKTQVEKYHAFFTNYLGTGNVQNALFALDGSNPSGGGSTALTATLAAGALASAADNRSAFVQNLWTVSQQQGLYRYYQETVYMLGLLAAAGRFSYDFGAAP